MYKPMQEDFPQAGHPQGLSPQGGLPTGVSPQETLLSVGGNPQGYPPQGSYPHGSGPPQGFNPQGDFSPVVSPQESFPPPGGYPQDPTKTQPKSQQFPAENYNMPAPGFAPVADLGEDGHVKGFDFSEKSIRKAFIRKVYAILMSQLAVTLAFISIFTFHEPTKIWVMKQPIVVIVAVVVTFVCLIAMACCESVRRKAPMNFIFLGIFTVGESILLGFVSSTFDSDVVMMAVGITAAICLALTLFAMQTRFDFTAMGGILLCFLTVFFLFGIIAIFIPGNRVLNLFYACTGAFLFSLYLIFDTQLMMAGQHKYTVSPEEYIFAALNLYLDVINIFLYILRIIAELKS